MAPKLQRRLSHVCGAVMFSFALGMARQRDASEALTKLLSTEEVPCSCSCCEAVPKLPSEAEGANDTPFKCIAKTEDLSNEPCPEHCSTTGAEGGAALGRLETALTSAETSVLQYCFHVCAPREPSVAADCTISHEDEPPLEQLPPMIPPPATDSTVIISEGEGCRDDPEGLVAEAGGSCKDVVTSGCETLNPDWNGRPIMVSELCPKSCGKCDVAAKPPTDVAASQQEHQDHQRESNRGDTTGDGLASVPSGSATNASNTRVTTPSPAAGVGQTWTENIAAATRGVEQHAANAESAAEAARAAVAAQSLETSAASFAMLSQRSPPVPQRQHVLLRLRGFASVSQA